VVLPVGFFVLDTFLAGVLSSDFFVVLEDVFVGNLEEIISIQSFNVRSVASLDPLGNL
jgi:hypothetical protein